MKKFLLLGAAAVLACSANAQSLKEITKFDTQVAEWAANVRNAEIVGDKLAVANMSTNCVELYDMKGNLQKSYDILDFNTTNEIGIHGEDSLGNPTFNAYKIGRAIAVDAAGNIVVNLNFPNAASANEFVVIDPEGAMTHVSCEVPSPATATRADFISAAGDVLTNGFIAVAPTTQANVIVYNIFEGEQDKDYSYLVTSPVALTNETKIAFPDKTVEDDADKAPEFYVYHRGYANKKLLRTNDTKNELVDVENVGNGGAGSTGLAAFTIDGVKYAVLPAPNAAGSRTTALAIYDVEKGEKVAGTEGPLQVDKYAEDFSAVVNANGTAYISQLVQGTCLVVYEFTPAGSSAIEEIAADNAPVEYYNLQGVKVANPENGVFVKKQGAKAVKVVL